MNKTWIKYVVDMGLLITLIIMITTGLTRFSELLAIFGINYAALAQFLPIYEMRLIHDISGVIFISLSIIHLALNWNSMVAMTKRAFGRGQK
jgi:predicted ABC-type exoprotein transport system permease subunit